MYINIFNFCDNLKHFSKCNLQRYLKTLLILTHENGSDKPIIFDIFKFKLTI